MLNKIRKIQESYFTLVEDYLGDFYKLANKKDGLYGKVIKELYENKISGLSHTECELTLDSFEEDISKIWKKNFWTITKEIEELNGVKTYNFFVPMPKSFSLTDTHATEIFRRFGLYSDTIILDDPMWRAVANKQEYEVLFRYMKFLIYGLNILKMKNIVLADVDQPIALIVSLDSIDSARKKQFQSIVEEQICMFSSTLFQKKLASLDQIKSFMDSKIKSLKEFQMFTKNQYTNNKFFIDAVKELFKLKTTGDSGIRYFYGDGLPYVLPKKEIFSDIFIHAAYGYVSYSNQIYLKSSLIDSFPLFTEKKVWEESNQFLMNDYSMTASYLKGKTPTHLIGVNVLADDTFKWLGNVPEQTLIELRKKEELSNFRHFFSDKLNEYHDANLENINKIIKDLNYSLSNAFKKHEQEVNELLKKYSIKKDIGKLIVSGSIAISGSVYFPLGVLGTILGGKTITDIFNNIKQKKSEIEILNKRPVAICYEAYKDEATENI